MEEATLLEKLKEDDSEKKDDKDESKEKVDWSTEGLRNTSDTECHDVSVEVVQDESRHTDQDVESTVDDDDDDPLHNNNSLLWRHQGSKLSLRSQDIVPENGCIMLGKGDATDQYITRFRVDTAGERRSASKGVFLEECCMCLGDEHHHKFSKCILSIMMSESFLLSFHLGALSLGIVKSSINREDIDEDLELAHSILEILAVSFVLFARVMLVRMSLHEVKQYKKSHQHFDEQKDKNIIGKHLKHMVLIYIITSIMLVLSCVAAFFIFYHFSHLGWTTLVNNSVLIIATVLSNIVLKKLGNVRSVIIEDEHKIVLYEALLLLKEGRDTMGAQKKKTYDDRVSRYIKSIFDTELFQQPDHIQLMDKYGPRWNTVTTMDVLSAI